MLVYFLDNKKGWEANFSYRTDYFFNQFISYIVNLS